MGWFDFAKRSPQTSVGVGTPDGERGPLRFDPSVTGRSGLRQYGGYVTEEWLPELAGPKAAMVYREMSDNDAIVGAVVFAISMLVRGAKWSPQAADETPEAEKGKEFVEAVIDEMMTPLADVIDEVTSMFVYGYAPMEIVWCRRDDGSIGLRGLYLRAQPTVLQWEIDPNDDSIDGLYQQPYTGPRVFIPIEKMLLFRTTTMRTNPEGRSILRTAYKSWFFKKKLEAVEAIGVERDLAGLPVAYIPGEYMSSTASNDDKAVFLSYTKLVQNIRRDQSEGIVMPNDRDAEGNRLFELELLNSGGSRTFDTTKIIDRYNKGIATSVLADFIFLGQSAVGSFALSSDKTALFAEAIGGFLDSIQEVFNRHLLPRLWALNNFPPETMPTLTHGDIENPNIAELGAYITALAGTGMPLFPDRDLENHLREVAGLPQAPEDGSAMPSGAPGYDAADPTGAAQDQIDQAE